MNMRLVTVSTIALLLSSPAALAYENYLPLGTGYSTNVESLPEAGSEEAEVAQQSDVYESELYWKRRKQIEEESRFKNFFSNGESNGSEDIDY
jgi:hypothetical protein